MSDDKKTTIVGGPPEFFILHRPAKLPFRRLAIAAIIGSAVVLIFVLALLPSPFAKHSEVQNQWKTNDWSQSTLRRTLPQAATAVDRTGRRCVFGWTNLSTK